MSKRAVLYGMVSLAALLVLVSVKLPLLGWELTALLAVALVGLLILLTIVCSPLWRARDRNNRG